MSAPKKTESLAMTDIELLPLPTSWDCWVANKMEAYARANVAHATAAKDAEIEALRAEVKSLQTLRDVVIENHGYWKARAERLETALQMIAGTIPCPDSLMGNVDIAIAALRDYGQEGKDGQN